MARINPFQSSFSLKDIGTGKLYSAGNLSSQRPKGLAKALQKSKQTGRTSFAKNLSRKDLDKFKDVIGGKLSKLPTGIKSLPRSARISIMARGEQLRRKGEISLADKKDLKDMVQALAPNRPTVTDQVPTDSKPIASTPINNSVQLRTNPGLDGNLSLESTDYANNHLGTRFKRPADQTITTFKPRPLYPKRQGSLPPPKNGKNENKIVDLDIG